MSLQQTSLIFKLFQIQLISFVQNNTRCSTHLTAFPLDYTNAGAFSVNKSHCIVEYATFFTSIKVHEY